MKCWFLTTSETWYKKKNKITDKCQWLAFVIFVFHGTHKNMEGGLHRQPVWKYLHLYCEGGRKHEAADGRATWTLHFLCSQLSAFCHLFHSPSQKALQVQAIWVQMNVWICNSRKPVSVMEGVWLFSAVGIAATKEVTQLPGKPCWQIQNWCLQRH